MDGLVSGLTKWASRPFREEMNLLDWALFVGLILILAAAWGRVMKHITA